MLDKTQGMADAIVRAEQEAGKRGGVTTRQFANPDNPEAHRLWAAQEILTQMPQDACLVTVLPDRMDRYFSTELFEPFR